MNTSQLLLVSSLGLGVNLFGMFAMGGHHHHVRHPFPFLSAILDTVLTMHPGWALAFPFSLAWTQRLACLAFPGPVANISAQS